ncbi:unnamed protein product [Spirodela intermedia]|uniref:Uncharacterized protein n=1 Tax=Spirodela intermedia TaxID=51605 RepID=A0A7I8IT97_SPIIN|nr:unnamed protein product [Spirodela intermedia]CAA6660834.1 unnamed protein product [Spirodela intermedia]
MGKGLRKSLRLYVLEAHKASRRKPTGGHGRPRGRPLQPRRRRVPPPPLPRFFVERAPPSRDGGGGVAVVTFSRDPCEDFRRSMQEMMEARAPSLHRHILRAFSTLVLTVRRPTAAVAEPGGAPTEALKSLWGPVSRSRRPRRGAGLLLGDDQVPGGQKRA